MSAQGPFVPGRRVEGEEGRSRCPSRRSRVLRVALPDRHVVPGGSKSLRKTAGKTGISSSLYYPPRPLSLMTAHEGLTSILQKVCAPCAGVIEKDSIMEA